MPLLFESKKFRRKEKKDRPFNAKIVNKQQANKVVVLSFALICLIVAMGSIRSFTVISRMNNLESELETIGQENRRLARTDNGLDVILVNRVMDEFVPQFMNVSFGDNDVIEERLEALSEFVSFDIRTLNDGIHQEYQRVLNSFELITVSERSHFNLAVYRVDYRIDGAGEEGDQKEGLTQDFTTVLNIPFVIQEGLLTIVSMPYFTAEVSALGQAPSFEMMVENDTSDEMNVARESIEGFLPTFFDMYAQSNERDLELFMYDVVLMGGNFELEGVDTFGARYEFVGDDVLVQVSVSFRDVATGFTHQVPFTLLLQQQANSWFVLEMHHVFIK